MDEPKYSKGGWVMPGTTEVRLHEGERIIDRHGHVRGQVFNGRLLWFPLWLSARLPKIPGR